jgi:hypothetical protein
MSRSSDSSSSVHEEEESRQELEANNEDFEHLATLSKATASESEQPREQPPHEGGSYLQTTDLTTEAIPGYKSKIEQDI